MDTTCSKCSKTFAATDAHYTGLGVMGPYTRIRTYCPNCWRKVQWARSHANQPRRQPQPSTRPSAEERANLRYWERVDNYRELGHDPNSGWED